MYYRPIKSCINTDRIHIQMALKIKYSPGFSGECYQRTMAGISILGLSSVNDSGLLESLELRLGLPSWSPEGMTRAIAYRKALTGRKDQAFYSDSFNRDSLGTSASLLDLRDTLLMAGWDPSKDWKSDRLRTLSILEKAFDSRALPGEADRWRIVLSTLRECGNPFHTGDIIEVHKSKEVLPQVIVNVLELLGETVDWTPGKTDDISLNLTGKDASILSFVEYSDALEWIAGNGEKSGTVIINDDGMRLNAVLRRHGKAPVAANMESGNPGTPQIFKLGLSLLIEPVNIHNLLAYLQLPISPLPAGLARMLSRKLINANGLDEGMEKAIEDYSKSLPENDKKKLSENYNKYLGFLLNARRGDGKVSLSAARAYCKNIAEWATTRAVLSGDKPEQAFFQVLVAECTDMINLLAEEEEVMDTEQFDRFVRQLSRPYSGKLESDQLGSLHTVRSLGNIIDQPDNIIWLSCNGDLGNRWPYESLNASEIKELRNNGIIVPDKSVYAGNDFREMVNRLNSAKSITLCRSCYDKGEAMKEHPAVTLFRKAGVAETAMQSKTWSGPVTHFTKSRDYSVQKDLLGDFSRSESVSSIEKLIQYPFDYYLEYVLGFKDASSNTFKDETPTQGTVAHLVFKELAEESDMNLDNMERLINTEDKEGNDGFGSRVRRAATKAGATLLSPSNSINFTSFCGTLKESIRALIKVLRDNRLKPFACEKAFDVELGDTLGRTKGSVDFIAETLEGELVIIDFKYSKGKNYIDKLREESSIQLEIYTRAMRQTYPEKKVIATGYWFFKTNELHTCSTFLTGENVVIEPVTGNKKPLIERIEELVQFRKNEMKNGYLEIYENENISDTNCYTMHGDTGLLHYKGNREPKKEPPFTPTHSVLKDDLK